jgi:phage replication O-like protein O
MQYTTIPNIVFDLSTDLDPYSFKVLMYIIRKTLGWHKQYDRISLSQLTEMTGISKDQVRRSLNKLQKLKLIACAKKGNGKAISEYWLTDLILRDVTGQMAVPLISGVANSIHRGSQQLPTK